MSQVDFPFNIDHRGHSASTDEADHIRDMIEQLLFTAPGERVNRPDFGSGLMQLVFQPNSPELAASLQFTTRAALQQWLGDVIEVQSIDSTYEDSLLRISVSYMLRRNGEQRIAEFERSV